jgi:hypothetical protein
VCKSFGKQRKRWRRINHHATVHGIHNLFGNHERKPPPLKMKEKDMNLEAFGIATKEITKRILRITACRDFEGVSSTWESGLHAGKSYSLGIFAI